MGSKYKLHCEHTDVEGMTSTVTVTFETESLEYMLTGMLDFIRGCGYILDSNVGLALVSNDDVIISQKEIDEGAFILDGPDNKDDDNLN